MSHTPQEDLNFLKRCDDWPRWPTMPVKRRDGQSNRKDFIGFVHTSNLSKVYFENTYRLSELAKDLDHPTWKDILSKIKESKEYESPEKLLEEYTLD